MTETSYLSDCYKYNNSINKWQSIKPMSTPRVDFSFVSLDSKLYAIGGLNDYGALNSVETYNKTTNTWKPVSSMNLPRFVFSAAIVNNSIYVCGGYNGTNNLKSCEYYSSNQDKWFNTTSMTIERQGLSMVLHDGFIYAIGGYIINNTDTTNNNYTNLVEKFDTKSKQWSPNTANMQLSRQNPGSVSFRGKLYVCGGEGTNGDEKSCETYDPKTNKWSTIASMNDKRSNFNLLVNDNNLYALGSSVLRFIDTAELYDYIEDKWVYTTLKVPLKNPYGV
ncbi:kelch-like protein 17 [Oppia nitens]|uniref:kelch-like protein 17 n=1 Tax=Oppia nitens TaxID=1686743 RepID=UPI0023DCC43A|nr:kelch-like protein 17 [Oppia nitens]